MSIRERLETDLKQAMKSRDAARTSCLRMIKAKMLEREVALRGERGLDYRLDDEEALAVIAGYAKQRRDSIESYRQGGRDDLVAAERAELGIVEEYLPARLPEDEIRAAIRAAIAETGAAGPSGIGVVMRAVMPRLKGAADGATVQRLARELLEGQV